MAFKLYSCTPVEKIPYERVMYMKVLILPHINIDVFNLKYVTPFT